MRTAATVLLMVGVVLCWGTAVRGLDEVRIPQESDWTYRGAAPGLEHGIPGAWDQEIFPATMVKKDGVYYLYCIGIDGFRSTDGGPRHRALGVATSTDGINFTKYAGNPVLTHLPHYNEEEGVGDAGAMIDTNGDILLYYVAIWAADATTESVQCYGALARSSDGTTVQDQGYILDWADPSVWGYGDELMLQGAYYHNGTYNVYYLAKGYGVSWGLGVASGPAKESISTDTRAALVEGQYIGGCNPISIDANTIALFIEESFTNRTIEVRKANVNTPEDFSAPIEMYTVAPYHIFSTIYLDRETSTWFMYQTDQTGGGNQIIVRTAPMQFVPPSTPYYGTPFAVPCRIEAEDYNLGSQHVAYWDADAGNNGGQYRVDDVDLENALDDGGGYNVGWTHVGEWLEYTVDVANAGMYRIDARVASGEGGGTFRILMDGVDVTGAQSFDDTGGSQNWITRTVPSEVFLDSGQQVLRVSIEQSGWTLNWIEFAKAGGGGCSMAQREARATSMLILALYLIPAVALVLIVRTRRRK